MALKDQITLGMSLPHRSPDPIETPVIRQVAQHAETLGFSDLWVTNNTLDHAGCFDSLTLLTYAAALTTTIRLGVSVLVLPVYNLSTSRTRLLPGLSQRWPGVLGIGWAEQHTPSFNTPERRYDSS
jgi:hypothetical protein